MSQLALFNEVIDVLLRKKRRVAADVPVILESERAHAGL